MKQLKGAEMKRSVGLDLFFGHKPNQSLSVYVVYWGGLRRVFRKKREAQELIDKVFDFCGEELSLSKENVALGSAETYV